MGPGTATGSSDARTSGHARARGRGAPEPSGRARSAQVIRRGYAIVRRVRDNRIVRDPKQVRVNDQITAEVGQGKIRAIVMKDEDDLFA